MSLLSNGTAFWWTHEPHSINDHEPTQDQPVSCVECGGRIELVNNKFGSSWFHDSDPGDGHTGVPRRVTMSPRFGEVA